MKTTSQKNPDSLSRFKNKKIEQPHSITGGGKIKKDKSKRPKNQG